MTTKISTHMLKLLHDVSKVDSGSRWGRRGRGGRGSRGRSCKICICRLHMWPFCSKLCYTPPNRLLTNSTHDIKVRRGRNRDLHVGEDTYDSWRKDELITCSRVAIAIYNRFYHMWWKVNRKTFQKGKKEMSTRLGDSVIVKPWSKYKCHHHIKEPWSLSELGCRKIKGTSPQHDLFTEKWGQLVSRDGREMMITRAI